jgi:hypothetical protein
VLLRDRHRVSESVSRPPQDFESSLRWILGNNCADHGYRLRAEGRQLIDKGYPDTEQIKRQYSFHQLRAQEDLVLQRCRGEDLVQDDDGPGGRLFQDVMYPDKVILKLPAEIFDLLLSLEVCEHVIEQKKLRVPARHGTANAAEVRDSHASPKDGPGDGARSGVRLAV